MRAFDSLLKTYSSLVYIFLYLPLVVLVVFSFSSNAIVSWPFGKFTLRWYYDLMANDQIKTSLGNTMMVGVISAFVTTVIGTISTYGIMRYVSRKLAFAFLAFLVFPELLPDMVKGIAQLMFFNQIGIPLSLWTVIVSHVVFCLPYTALLTASGVVSLDVSLEEASMDLGAGRLQTFRYVILPLMMPAIFASMIFAFTLSINDYLVTTFVAGSEPLLPLVFWGMIKFGISPMINAVSTVIFIISVAASMIGFYWLTRSRRRFLFF